MKWIKRITIALLVVFSVIITVNVLRHMTTVYT